MIKTKSIFLLIFILSLTIIVSSLFAFSMPFSKLIHAQSDATSIKSRNLIIDLGNGIKTNAQLTIPTSGNGPYPGVLLVNLGGPQDMNDTVNIIINGTHKTIKQFWQIAQYLSEKGFAVLRYDKRGIEGNGMIDDNVWANATFNDLQQDAQKALVVLMHQPDVDVNKISIIGHSEGTQIAPRIAIGNAGKIKNIILMSASAQNESDSTYNNILGILRYAKEVVDKNKDGLISIKEAIQSQIRHMLFINDSTDPLTFDPQFNPLQIKNNGSNRSSNNESYVSIDNGIKPFLMNIIRQPTKAELSGPCVNVQNCPKMKNSIISLPPLLNIIYKVPSNTSILMLEGENDSPEQVLMLNQRLNEIHHPDHSFIIYKGLGHLFYPSPKLFPQIGPIPDYVLHDIFLWLNDTK